MKKALLVFIVLFSVSYAADAQWQVKSCDVADIYNYSSEEFECLWERSSKNARIGVITTSVGLVFVGTLAIFGSLAFAGGGTFNNAMTFISFGGAVVGIFAGTPYLITWAVRRSRLKENPLYEALYQPSFNLSPTINKNHFNNSYSVGFTATLSF